MMKMSGNALTLSIRTNSPATASVGAMNGSRTCRKICQRFAPSIRAASIGLSGTICSAASAISIVNGKCCQVPANTIAHSAVDGFVSSGGIGRPIHARKRWIGLMSTVNSASQVMPTTIGGSTIGTSIHERASWRIGVFG